MAVCLLREHHLSRCFEVQQLECAWPAVLDPCEVGFKLWCKLLLLLLLLQQQQQNAVVIAVLYMT
jgi:hypothetical protein